MGYPHPDYLLQYLTGRQLAEWMAFDIVDPFGKERGDIGVGIIASTIANVNRGKNTPPFKPKDFMPQFGEESKPKEQSLDELKAKCVELSLMNFPKINKPYAKPKPNKGKVNPPAKSNTKNRKR